MQAEARRNLNAWLRTYGIATLLYLAALGVAIWSSISEPAGVTKNVLVLTPIVPGLSLIYLGIRSYRQSDEYIRQRIEQSAALAAVLAAILALIYSFLELAGLPRPSAVWLWNFMSVFFVVQMLKLLVIGR
jgi:uncharacterized membrane protein YphA (DoxX/SURF4 family)